MKFTVRGIEALKLRTDRYDMLESDGHGFGVRVAPSGPKSPMVKWHALPVIAMARLAYHQ